MRQILNALTHLAEIQVAEPQNNPKNNGTNFNQGHMGQIPVIRCFVHNFFQFSFFYFFCIFSKTKARDSHNIILSKSLNSFPNRPYLTRQNKTTSFERIDQSLKSVANLYIMLNSFSSLPLVSRFPENNLSCIFFNPLPPSDAVLKQENLVERIFSVQ